MLKNILNRLGTDKPLVTTENKVDIEIDNETLIRVVVAIIAILIVNILLIKIIKPSA